MRKEPIFQPNTAGVGGGINPHDVLQPGSGGGKGKKGAADKTGNQLDSLEKGLGIDGIGEIQKFLDQKKILDDALAKGLTSASAKLEGLTPEQAYARDIKALNDKMLEAIGASTAYGKALNAVAKETSLLAGAKKLGLIDDAAYAAGIARTEEAHKKVLQPMQTEMDKLAEENKLLGMGTKERLVAAEVSKLTAEARLSGDLKPNGTFSDAEIKGLEKQIDLHTQLEKWSANQNVGLQAWANSFSDLYTEMGKVEQKLAGDLTDALTKFITSPGQFNKGGGFGKMFKDLTAQMTKGMVENGLSGISQLIGLTGPDGTSPSGSAIGGMLSSVTGIDFASLMGHGKPTAANPLAGVIEGDAMRVKVVEGGGGSGGSGGSGTGSSPAGAGTAGATAGGGILGALGAHPGTGGGGGALSNVMSGVMGKQEPGSYGSAFQSGGLLGMLGKAISNDSSLSFGQGAVGQPMKSLASSIGNWISPSMSGMPGGIAAATDSTGAITNGAALLNAQILPDALGASADAASAAADVAGAAGSSGGFLSSIGTWIASLFAAEGGITDNSMMRKSMPAHLWSGSVPHYSEGTQNTSGGGMPAMLHPNEAVIPLSRGRKVPVEMNGGSQRDGGRSTQPVVNVNVNATDVNSFRNSEAQISAAMGLGAMRAAARNG
jgi:hypothetical protein